MPYEDLPGGTGPGGDYADQDEWTPAIATVVRDNFINHEARIVALEDGPGFDFQYIDTDESQASGADYGDLATFGPAVTLTITGTTAVVELRALMRRPGGGGGFTGWMAIGVSGATTIAASNATGISAVGSAEQLLSGTIILTGLTPGENTFYIQYHNDGGGTWNYRQRMIKVYAK